MSTSQFRRTLTEASEHPEGIIAIAKKHPKPGTDRKGNPSFSIVKLPGFWFRRLQPDCQYYESPEPLDDVRNIAVEMFGGTAPHKHPDLIVPNRIFVTFPYQTPDEILNVVCRQMDSRSGKIVMCRSDTLQDNYNERGYSLTSEVMEYFNGQSAPISHPHEQRHYGWVAHRRAENGQWYVLPCDPDVCPYAKNKKGETTCKQKATLKVSLPWSGRQGGVFHFYTGYWRTIQNLHAKITRAYRAIQQNGNGLSMRNAFGWLVATPAIDAVGEKFETNYLVDFQFGTWHLKQVREIMEQEHIALSEHYYPDSTHKALNAGEEDTPWDEPQILVKQCDDCVARIAVLNPEDEGIAWWRERRDSFPTEQLSGLLDKMLSKENELLKAKEDAETTTTETTHPFAEEMALVKQYGTETQRRLFQQALEKSTIDKMTIMNICDAIRRDIEGESL